MAPSTTAIMSPVAAPGALPTSKLASQNALYTMLRFKSTLAILNKLCVTCVMRIVKTKRDTVIWNAICKTCKGKWASPAPASAIAPPSSALVKKSKPHCKPDQEANPFLRPNTLLSNALKPKTNFNESKETCTKVQALPPVPASPKKIKAVFKSSLSDEPSVKRKCTIPTIYQSLIAKNEKWCRYCGTSKGIMWKDGPWGKNTLCCFHGKAYSNEEPEGVRLNLSLFENEKAESRDKPIIQDYCFKCMQKRDLITCHGCPKAFHRSCLGILSPSDDMTVSPILPPENSDLPWFCSPTCKDNLKHGDVKVDLHKRRILPFLSGRPRCKTAAEILKKSLLMRTPKVAPSKTRKLSEESFTPVSKKRRTRIKSECDQILDDKELEESCRLNFSAFNLTDSIPTPSWSAQRKRSSSKLAGKQTTKSKKEEECTDDEHYLARHKRYEEFEKHTRILRPQILEQLYRQKK